MGLFRSFSSRKAEGPLLAFYDLDTSPPTFDIVKFLALAELHRKRTHLKDMHVVIVPGRWDGYRKGAVEGTIERGVERSQVHAYLGWNVRHLLEPCCWLVPSSSGVTVLPSRHLAHDMWKAARGRVFPEDYSVEAPVERYDDMHVIAEAKKGTTLQMLQPSSPALDAVEQWLTPRAKGRKTIVITLREAQLDTERNSDLSCWSAFAGGLDREQYYPVFVRDTAVALGPVPEELKGFDVCDVAPFSVELRAALYEMSYLHMAASCGPTILSVYNERARMLIVRPIVASSLAASEEHLRARGYVPGEPWPMCTPLQRVMWEDESQEALERGFTMMCELIGEP